QLANASNLQSDLTGTQIDVFNGCCEGIPGPRSIANSAGIIAWPESHADFVRPGLMLY
ncbi:MAG: alanine racemase, partial [Gammaproteobacteria bacterium]|nr:alanine racemase [Gammaproteobacteria bacterium]